MPTQTPVLHRDLGARPCLRTPPVCSFPSAPAPKGVEWVGGSPLSCLPGASSPEEGWQEGGTGHTRDHMLSCDHVCCWTSQGCPWTCTENARSGVPGAPGCSPQGPGLQRGQACSALGGGALGGRRDRIPPSPCSQGQRHEIFIWGKKPQGSSQRPGDSAVSHGSLPSPVAPVAPVALRGMGAEVASLPRPEEGQRLWVGRAVWTVSSGFGKEERAAGGIPARLPCWQMSRAPQGPRMSTLPLWLGTSLSSTCFQTLQWATPTLPRASARCFLSPPTATTHLPPSSAPHCRSSFRPRPGADKPGPRTSLHAPLGALGFQPCSTFTEPAAAGTTPHTRTAPPHPAHVPGVDSAQGTQ